MMGHQHFRSDAALVLAAILASAPLCDAATLRILRPDHCLDAGDEFIVTLWMLDLGAAEVAGFQAFLEFDPALLDLVEGEYAPTPLSLPIISPIAAAPGIGLIDLAAGIDVFAGQQPTSADGLLVALRFQALVAGPADSIGFRAHKPPTALTDVAGDPIPGLVEVNEYADSADINLDGVVNGLDLGILLANWSIPAGAAGCGATLACLSDLNCDGVVDGLDLGNLLASWTL